MSIWGRLFGSDSVIEKTVDGVYNGVDKLVYTDEERAERFERLLKLYEPFKIAQRFMALIVGIPYVLIHVLCSVIWLTGLFTISADPAYSAFVERISAVTAANNQTLGEPFGYIIIFYFLGGAGEGVARAVMERRK